MGLKLSLAPNERLYVNGAQISNPGTKSIRIEIDSDSIVLRESAFLKPEDVKTNLQFMAFAAQCLYLQAGPPEPQREQFVQALAGAMAEAQTAEQKQSLTKAALLANENQWGRCLSHLRQLIKENDATVTNKG